MRRLFLIAVLAVLCAPSVHAITIFSNFGPGYDYMIGAASPVTGSAARDHDEIDMAFGFVAGASGGLDAITLAMALADQSVPVNELALSLCGDAAGQPGTVLEAWTISVPIEYGFGFYNPPLTATSVLRPVLAAGTQYWLVAEAATEASTLLWDFNSTGDVGPLAFRFDSGAWGTDTTLRGAFEITGDEVSGGDIPEPSTLSLLGCGVGFLLLRRGRRSGRGASS